MTDPFVDKLEQLLRKKPVPDGPFKWMADWEDVSSTLQDESAYKLKVEGKKNYCDLKGINESQSPIELLAFLRYDYKKTLIRARYLYIDRLRCSGNKIKGEDLDYAFFEPILLCFPNIEFLGRILYSDTVDWSVKNPCSKMFLGKMLQNMGGGYKEHAEKLVALHRCALAHELRPDGVWTYDLNTEEKYGPPKTIIDGMLYLNIPHFIDSSLLEIEKLCNMLVGPNSNDVMKALSKYVAKRFTRHLSEANLTRNPSDLSSEIRGELDGE